ncbi:MAG: AAA family ATPase [Dermatophilaceae bacterium]|nr:AAA family ATPase [Dermatophilaceae bacterium]
MTTAPTLPLDQALDALVAVAESAGVRDQVARDEGAALAAAVAESAPGAPAAWARAVGGGTTQDFFDAASRGRRWRGAPTSILSGLVAQGSSLGGPYAKAMAEVASAACDLGEPTMRVIGNASVAAAAQLKAAGHHPSPPPSLVTQSPAPSPTLSEDRHRFSPAASDNSPEPAPEAAHERAPAAVPPEPVKRRSVEELLAELDALIGLGRVKREIHRQVALLRVERLRAAAGMTSATITRHLVFTGNPGTGKTTVARLVSGIYAALGLLTRGQLIEVDRSELVAGYLGQTAVKTSEVVSTASGGVLFIDEAYSLTGDQYGTEAVDTLVKEMEDRRDDLVVIVAGYPAPMEAFVAANPGLASRFRTIIEFDDYTDEELATILTLLAKGSDYELTPQALARFRELLAQTPRGESFGNGRFSRNQLEAAIGAHAWRLRDVEAPTHDQLRRLEPQDLDQDLDQDLGENQPPDKDTGAGQDTEAGQGPDKDADQDESRGESQDESADPDQDKPGGPA